MDLNTVIELIKVFGLPTALVVFFLYQDWQRRKKEDQQRQDLVDRLGEVEQYQRDKLEGMVVANTKALNEHAKVTKETAKTTEVSANVVRQLVISFKAKKCMADEASAIQDALNGGGE
jgi:hypothetical protein